MLACERGRSTVPELIGATMMYYLKLLNVDARGVASGVMQIGNSFSTVATCNR